jgi:hypothetical protein
MQGPVVGYGGTRRKRREKIPKLRGQGSDDIEKGGEKEAQRKKGEQSLCIGNSYSFVPSLSVDRGDCVRIAIFT